MLLNCRTMPLTWFEPPDSRAVLDALLVAELLIFEMPFVTLSGFVWTLLTSLFACAFGFGLTFLDSFATLGVLLGVPFTSGGCAGVLSSFRGLDLILLNWSEDLVGFPGVGGTSLAYVVG